jgi:hypothetical protein
MKNLGLALLLSLFPASAFASGCGSYDNFREVLETKQDGAPGDSQVSVMSANGYTAKVFYSGQTITLEYENEIPFNHETQGLYSRVNRRDIKFTEGNGCGPVYDCVTGQFVLTVPDFNKKTARVYTYPRIDEFREFANGPVLWKAGMSIPPTLGLKVDGDPSDIPQCVYGFW